MYRADNAAIDDDDGHTVCDHIVLLLFTLWLFIRNLQNKRIK